MFREAQGQKCRQVRFGDYYLYCYMLTSSDTTQGSWIQNGDLAARFRLKFRYSRRPSAARGYRVAQSCRITDQSLAPLFEYSS